MSYKNETPRKSNGKNALNVRKYRQAAISYVGIGFVIVVLTTAFIPEAHYRSGLIPLFGGIVVLLALAYFVYKGVRWLVIILCVFSAARSCWWFYSFVAFADEDTRWVYLINTLLNMSIVYMLARASVKNEPNAHQ